MRNFAVPAALGAMPLAAVLVLGLWPRDSTQTGRATRAGIEVLRPPEWAVRRTISWCFGGGPAVVVANRKAIAAGVAWGCSSTILRLPTPEGVAVRIVAGPARRDGSDRPTRFPLSLDRLHRLKLPHWPLGPPRTPFDPRGALVPFCSDCELFSQAISNGESHAEVHVQIGPFASAEDRAAVAQVVRSIRLLSPPI